MHDVSMDVKPVSVTMETELNLCRVEMDRILQIHHLIFIKETGKHSVSLIFIRQRTSQ